MIFLTLPFPFDFLFACRESLGKRLHLLLMMQMMVECATQTRVLGGSVLCAVCAEACDDRLRLFCAFHDQLL